MAHFAPEQEASAHHGGFRLSIPPRPRIEQGIAQRELFHTHRDAQGLHWANSLPNPDSNGGRLQILFMVPRIS
jgi:hypothetical protein